jgi:hypothetical protein
MSSQLYGMGAGDLDYRGGDGMGCAPSTCVRIRVRIRMRLWKPLRLEGTVSSGLSGTFDE